MKFSTKDLHAIANYIYVGLTLKESLILSGHPNLGCDSGFDSTLIEVIRYAKTKAKHNLMQRAVELATDKKGSMTSAQTLRNLLASRFGLTEDKYDRVQKSRQHEEMMLYKKQALRQWADYQTSKMVNEATVSQLEEYSKA